MRMNLRPDRKNLLFGTCLGSRRMHSPCLRGEKPLKSFRVRYIRVTSWPSTPDSKALNTSMSSCLNVCDDIPEMDFRF